MIDITNKLAVENLLNETKFKLSKQKNKIVFIGESGKTTDKKFTGNKTTVFIKLSKEYVSEIRFIFDVYFNGNKAVTTTISNIGGNICFYDIVRYFRGNDSFMDKIKELDSLSLESQIKVHFGIN